jgi:hypothetical protein
MAEVLWCMACAIADKRHTRATKKVDGDPMCDACAALAPAGSSFATLAGGSIRNEAAKTDFAKVHEALEARPKLPAAMPIESLYCSRGCGKLKHRGRCSGAAAASQGVKAAKTEFGAVAGRMESGIVAAPVAIPRPYETKAKPAAEVAAEFVDGLMVRRIPLSEVPRGMPHGKPGRIGALWLQAMALPKDEALTVPCRDISQASKTCSELLKRARREGVAIEGKRVGAVCYFWWRQEEQVA